MRDHEFDDKLNDVKKLHGCHLKNCTQFWGNTNAHNCAEIVEDIRTSQKSLGCKTSPKMHFLDSHMDLLPANLGAISDEHGGKFQQDI